jgi:cell division protein FtsQ
MPTDDDAVRPGPEHSSETRRVRRRARNRRVRPPLRQRIPGPGQMLRAAGVGCWRNRRALVSLSCAAGLVAASYAAGRYLATSDRFAIASAELHGAQRLAPEELEGVLGDLSGVNIFRANLARAEAQVEELPWVERARIRRDLPRTLSVEVVEREPAAVAYLGGLYLVDEHGVPFVRVRPGDAMAEGLVVITGLDRQGYIRNPDGAHETLRQAIEAARVYEAGDRPRLGELHVGARGELTFSTYDDAVAIRAEIEDFEQVDVWLEGFDAAWGALSPRERHGAKLFRIQGHGGPERVTVDFSGLIAGN